MHPTAGPRAGTARALVLSLLVALNWDAGGAHAVEGTTAAGPIGGTDIRAAQLPPPGLYAGAIFLAGNAYNLVDGNGQSIPALNAARFTARMGGAFIGYVPEFQLLGGSIGFLGVLPYGAECGRLFTSQPWGCAWGAGDPYLEITWSRYFGTPRPSRIAGSLPIHQGLTLSAGIGVVLPVGQYNVQQVTQQGIGMGNNTFDLAPSLAVTYMTKPIFLEGTEFSAKAYWNIYRSNPATQYHTADLINVDFAISERWGRFQAGITGVYAFQFGGDKQNGVTIAPDGRRTELLLLGGILAYDMPDLAMSMKIKAVTSVRAENAVHSTTVVVGFIKKLN
jgi:hypothetical protein